MGGHVTTNSGPGGELVLSDGLIAGGQLRRLELQHAEAMFAQVEANREHLGRWFGWVEKTRTVDDVRSSIQSSLAKTARGEAARFGIWFQGALVGNIDFHTIEPDHRSAMVGYWLAESAQGIGLATTAVRALVDYGFRELELNRIAIWCDVDNPRSRRVAERLGFVREGILRDYSLLNGKFVGACVYSVLRGEWPPGAATL